MKRFTLSFAFLAAFSLPAFSAPAEVERFKTLLTPALEKQLVKQTHREKVGVAITVEGQNNTCERCGSYTLKLPKHVLRDTVFDLEVHYHNQKPVLKGRVFTLEEHQLVTQNALQSFSRDLRIELESFPYQNIAPDYAITKMPSSSLYVAPRAEAGKNLATQVRLGTPVQILTYDETAQFALVRIFDDGYIAWIQRSHLEEVQKKAFDDWTAHREVLLMSNTNTPRLLYFGTRLKLLSDMGDKVKALHPDGTELLIAKDLVRVAKPGKPDRDKLLATARQYLPKATQGGGAYLWGGSLGKRLDCSGFVQTVFRANDVYLPRDADQQKGFTARVGNTLKDIAELQPADLVFFSGNGKYPTHVGIYIGDNKVIHSSPSGPYSGVKISTLQGGGDYDKMLQGIYFGGGRVTRSL